MKRECPHVYQLTLKPTIQILMHYDDFPTLLFYFKPWSTHSKFGLTIILFLYLQNL